jgi:hypothetical protein
MARLHTGIFVLCLFAFACTAHAEIGTVRLMEDHVLFASPAIATGNPDQFVKVMCRSDENNSTQTATSDPIQPLIRVRTGETLTILDVIPCGYKNGGYAVVRTMQQITGYTLLPNYETRIQTTDAEAAYKILFLIAPSCIMTHYEDPECRINAYAAPFANYVRLYPTSLHASKAAKKAASQYKYAADTFQYIADTGGHPSPDLKNVISRYTREELRAKAKEYRALENQMQALANQKPIQQPTQATARSAEPSTPTRQSSPQQTASTQPTPQPSVQTTPIPKPPQPAPSSAPAKPQPAPKQAETSPFPPLIFAFLAVAYCVGYFAFINRTPDSARV